MSQDIDTDIGTGVDIEGIKSTDSRINGETVIFDACPLQISRILKVYTKRFVLPTLYRTEREDSVDVDVEKRPSVDLILINKT